MKDLKYLTALDAAPGPYNDIQFNAAGDIVTVEGHQRVKQDVAKILITESGLLPYPNYGTSLPEIPKTAAYTPTLLNNISMEVISAVHYLIFIEDSDLTSEQIDSLKNLEVSFTNSAVNISLVLTTKDSQEVTLGFTA